MKNTPRGCLTAGGAKPPRVTPYISIQLVSVCKHSNSGGALWQGADSPRELSGGLPHHLLRACLGMHL